MQASKKAVDVGSRWRSRPALSALVRGFAVLSPAVLAAAFSIAASRAVPPPSGPWFRVAWWIGISVLSTGVLLLVHRWARRLLPLAALLKLALLFPDQAPTRYKLARTVGRPQDLARQLDRAREAGRHGADVLGAQAVLELVAALSVHDRATRGHSERVRIFTDLIAVELRLPQPDQDRLRWAALLHDVGKLEVSAAILRKAGAPSAGEWVMLKEHPAHGSRLIAPIAPWLGPWARAVEDHHERFDGTGYPHGLSALDISLGGRIVAVADSYETMTAARPYKRPISPTAARDELVRCSGAQFDPAIVRAFLNISLGRLWKTIGLGAWVSQVPLLPQVASGLTTAGAQAGPIAAKGAIGLALVASVTAATPNRAPATAPTTAPAVSATEPLPPPVKLPAHLPAPSTSSPSVSAPHASAPSGTVRHGSTPPAPVPVKPTHPPDTSPAPTPASGPSDPAKPPKPVKAPKPPKGADGASGSASGSGATGGQN